MRNSWQRGRRRSSPKQPKHPSVTFGRPILPPEWLQDVASTAGCLSPRQCRWTSGDMDRFCHSIVPKVSMPPCGTPSSTNRSPGARFDWSAASRPTSPAYAISSQSIQCRPIYKIHKYIYQEKKNHDILINDLRIIRVCCL